MGYGNKRKDEGAYVILGLVFAAFFLGEKES